MGQEHWSAGTLMTLDPWSLPVMQQRSRAVSTCRPPSRVRLFATPWTVARQAPLSMGFSRQAYWSELPCPPRGDLTKSGFEHRPLTSPALTGGVFTISAYWEATMYNVNFCGIIFPKKLFIPSPGESSQPRDQTSVSCIAGRFFTS